MIAWSQALLPLDSGNKRVLAPGPRLQRTALWPSSICSPSHQAKRPWESVGHSGHAPLEPITPTRLPQGSRDPRILWSNSSNPLLGPEQTFLDPPSRKWRLYLCPLVDTRTQCLGRLWRGFECIIWAVPTHVGQATHSSGWR